MSEYTVPVTVTADGGEIIDAVRKAAEAAVPSCSTSWAKVYRLPEHEFGDDVHAAIKAWLEANEIDPGVTPQGARFIIENDHVQIVQFDMHVNVDRDQPRKSVSLLMNGFVKTERCYPLKEPISGFEPLVEMVAVA